MQNEKLQLNITSHDRVYFFTTLLTRDETNFDYLDKTSNVQLQCINGYFGR